MPLSHINEVEYTDASEQAIKVTLFDGKLFYQIREDLTGQYGSFKVIQDNDIKIIKNMYGGNGDDTNISVTFGVTFPNAAIGSFNNLKKQAVRNAVVAAAPGSAVTEIRVDSSGSSQDGFNLIITVSYSGTDFTAGETFYELVKNTASPNIDTTVFANFLSPYHGCIPIADFETTTYGAKVIERNVPASFVSITRSAGDTAADTKFTIVTAGNYDHWAVKYNEQDDNDYVRIRTKDEKDHTYAGVAATAITTAYVTLFDSDYKELYEYTAAYSGDSTTLPVTELFTSTKNNYY